MCRNVCASMCVPINVLYLFICVQELNKLSKQ